MTISRIVYQLCIEYQYHYANPMIHMMYPAKIILRACNKCKL
eukprot:CAMPEP_0184497232 /NCGR_PEP_ID=MMETSP0113_2-20130426/35989_1 /TAXON_ID=91329 /ORGANISM="Norrisiella sphaerica, Strain BC52" /LENGTH=41 /DNA_ID= /DNA_START= /DNA_END= /DNA_ORIENTATION=